MKWSDADDDFSPTRKRNSRWRERERHAAFKRKQRSRHKAAKQSAVLRNDTTYHQGYETRSLLQKLSGL